MKKTDHQTDHTALLRQANPFQLDFIAEELAHCTSEFGEVHYFELEYIFIRQLFEGARSAGGDFSRLGRILSSGFPACREFVNTHLISAAPEWNQPPSAEQELAFRNARSKLLALIERGSFQCGDSIMSLDPNGELDGNSHSKTNEI